MGQLGTSTAREPVGNEDPGQLERAVRGRIESMTYLPTTLGVAMKFIELGKNPETEPAEYARVVAADASLSSKLLSLANSSWFGVRHKVTKVNMAVNLLGLSTVRTLAISYCVTGLHNELKLEPQESSRLWAAALSKALAAKQYALTRDNKVAEEAFAAGLFQDFALPFMYATAKAPMLNLLENTQGDWKWRQREERALFRLDHAELGRAIAQKLDLPEVFIDAVAFHHEPASLREFLPSPVLAEAVHVASLFPHLLTGWCRQEADELRRFLSEHGQPSVEQFLEEVQKEFDTLHRYFEHGGNAGVKLQELLAHACAEIADNTTRLVGTVQDLLQQVAGAGREMHQMMQEQKRVEETAARDPLTGALNREGFTGGAQELLTKACRYRSGLALAFVDVDHFKVLNDTHGHAQGDAALRMIVSVLQDNIRQQDLVARLGGDEFVLLLGDCSQEGAVQALQRIVSRVATQHVGSAGATVSLSAGLIWTQPREGATTVQALLNLADGLMYEAKRAGGNRLWWRAVAPKADAA